MCGFIFIRSKKKYSKNKILSACSTIKHRGPDKTNNLVIKDKHGYEINFTHFLLDISGKNVVQPIISNQKKNNFTLFNGEIYNYDDKFSSDTNFLQNIFDNSAIDSLSKLDGEFAIINYDEDKERCIVYVDTFLTKPLFYSLNNNTGEFIIASYKSAIKKMGFKDISQFKPNTKTEFLINKNKVVFKQSNDSCFKFNISQYKENFLDWENAFIEAVRKRATHGSIKPFVSLSSGYDSAAICCALNILNIKYDTYSFLTNENHDLIKNRIEINKTKSCLNSYLVKGINFLEKKYLQSEFFYRIENFSYSHSDHNQNNVLNLHEDGGSLGSLKIAKIASKKNKVHLSSCGADEIISDYGMNGKKIYFHSEFAGIFPKDLKKIFPWKKFYGDTQRSYLFKEEFVFGSYGIEARYPFLDNKVVQEYLNLTSKLKNSDYKSPISFFLKKHDYPFEKSKTGFNPRNYLFSNLKKYIKTMINSNS